MLILWYWFNIFGMVLHFLAGACPPSTVTKFVGMDARFAEHTSHAWKKSPEQSVAFRNWYRGPLRMALAQLFMFPNRGMLVHVFKMHTAEDLGVYSYIYIYEREFQDSCNQITDCSCWTCNCVGLRELLILQSGTLVKQAFGTSDWYGPDTAFAEGSLSGGKAMVGPCRACGPKQCSKQNSRLFSKKSFSQKEKQMYENVWLNS